MPQTLAVIGAVTSVVGTVASHRQQRKASRAQQQQQTLARRRSARQNIRQAQISRARALASAQGSGAVGGSGQFGGINSIGSRLGGALGFSSQQSALSGVVASAQSRAQTFSGIAGLGGSLFNLAGGFDSIFPGEQQPQRAQNTPIYDLTQPY